MEYLKDSTPFIDRPWKLFTKFCSDLIAVLFFMIESEFPRYALHFSKVILFYCFEFLLVVEGFNLVVVPKALILFEFRIGKVTCWDAMCYRKYLYKNSSVFEVSAGIVLTIIFLIQDMHSKS